jgi:hypothetical protein
VDAARTTASLRRAPWASGDASARVESHLRAVEVPRRRRSRKTRLTVYLSVDIIDTLRNIAYWTKGATLAGLVEESLREGIASREHLNGGPFIRRLEELKGGRPRRSASGASV